MTSLILPPLRGGSQGQCEGPEGPSAGSGPDGAFRRYVVWSVSRRRRRHQQSSAAGMVLALCGLTLYTTFRTNFVYYL